MKAGDAVEIVGGSYAGQKGKITALNGTTQATVDIRGIGSKRLHLTSLAPAPGRSTTSRSAAAAPSLPRAHVQVAPPLRHASSSVSSSSASSSSRASGQRSSASSRSPATVPATAASLFLPSLDAFASLGLDAAVLMAQAGIAPTKPTTRSRSSAAAADDDGDIYNTLRGVPVSHLAEEVWNLRLGQDLYTRSKRQTTGVYEVDHIVEIQLHAHAAQQMLSNSTVRNITRAVSKKFSGDLAPFASQLGGLNNTTKAINSAKKGPFQRFIHLQKELADAGSYQSRTLEELARETARNSDTMKKMLDDGTW